MNKKPHYVLACDASDTQKHLHRLHQFRPQPFLATLLEEPEMPDGFHAEVHGMDVLMCEDGVPWTHHGLAKYGRVTLIVHRQVPPHTEHALTKRGEAAIPVLEWLRQCSLALMQDMGIESSFYLGSGKAGTAKRGKEKR